MLTNLYYTINLWAKSKYANIILAITAFTESFIFIIPPDVILIPLCYFNKHKALLYALITTLFSVMGGIVGYYLGYFLYINFISYWIDYFNYTDIFITFKNLYLKFGFIAIFIAGFTPIPYKIATIASGALGVNIILFIIASVLSRGIRFFIIAILISVLKKLQLTDIKKNISTIIWICSIIIFLLIIIYFILY